MRDTGPKVSKISESSCFDVDFKETQEILNTQHGSPVACGVNRIVCTLYAWFSWYMQCEWLEGVWVSQTDLLHLFETENLPENFLGVDSILFLFSSFNSSNLFFEPNTDPAQAK